MTSKSITLHASTGLLPSYGRVAVQGESQTAWDSVHLGDLSTKHVAPNGQGMRIPVVADVPYASARSKGRVPIPCAVSSREKRDFSDEPCAIFLLNFQVAGLGFRSQPHRHSRREVATSAMLPAIKYPLQAHFHVSVLHRKPMTTYAMALNLPRLAPSGRSQPR